MHDLLTTSTTPRFMISPFVSPQAVSKQKRKVKYSATGAVECVRMEDVSDLVGSTALAT